MDNDVEYTHAIATATYKSGRVEEVMCKLRTDGTPTKVFSRSVSALRSFPSIQKVSVRKVVI